MISNVNTATSVHSGQSGMSSGGQQSITILNNLRNRLHQKQNEVNATFVFEAFIQNLQLENYDLFTDEERELHLAKFDAIEMLNALEELNRELAAVKIENHYLKDFLEKNDPKLLIGLSRGKTMGGKATRTNAIKGSAAVSRQSSTITLATTGHFSMSMRSGTTMQSTVSGSRRPGYDYRLNFRAKADMAEKAASDVEKRIKEIDARAMREIKLLNGRIEELHLRTEETKETAANFRLHFLRDHRDIKLLETGTEKQLDRKLKKFVNNWIKNARALLGKMRLQITAMHEMCLQYRNDLITKADLSGILGAVDFEQLMIKRQQLLQSLDDKNNHLAGLKGVAGKASLAMSEEKQTMMTIEDEGKRIANKTVEVIKAISKLEKEAAFVEESNNKDAVTLVMLKEQLQKYEAPSVNEYIEKKDELLILEKEEKMLQRKNYILGMKLSNVLKKCKKRDDYYVY